MSKNILVTGANGFVGHHLVAELVAAGHTVVGVGQDAEPSDRHNGALSSYIQCDLTSEDDVKAKVSFDGIDAVIHLAGLANVGQSFAQPAFFIAANAAMSVNLLQYALDQRVTTRFIVISSGAVYESNQPLPINESGAESHGSPYSVSKLAVEMMNDYYRSRGVDVVTMRPFNHFGPNQSKGFIVPDLLAKFKEFQANGTPISVGNLDTARDYTDVRDVAKAYIAVATSDAKPQHPVYNVCSGSSKTGRQIYDSLATALQLSPAPEPSVDQSLIRPNDVMDIYGDASRIKDEFGWNPQHSFDQSIKDTVEAA